jgi:hypothetical protein
MGGMKYGSHAPAPTDHPLHIDCFRSGRRSDPVSPGVLVCPTYHDLWPLERETIQTYREPVSRAVTN